MRILKLYKIPAFMSACGLFFSCTPAEIQLHGEISGLAQELYTGNAIPSVSVRLVATDSIFNPFRDTTTTNEDGTFAFSNLTPGSYEIRAKKQFYGTESKTIMVNPGRTEDISFTMTEIAIPGFSKPYLDFGLDSTTISFKISNTGRGKMIYVITSTYNWITISPYSGEVTDETDLITVTINKPGISSDKIIDSLKILSISEHTYLEYYLRIYVNGVMHRDLRYYSIVKIGPKIWMKENLSYGTYIFADVDQQNNGIVEKWLFQMGEIYGGFYHWNEMMQYESSDIGTTGSRMGVCPTGWHLPTNIEMTALINNLGGSENAGIKLILNSGLWKLGSGGATNESGFSGLPGGWKKRYENFVDNGLAGYWWTATEITPSEAYVLKLTGTTTFAEIVSLPKSTACNVRCVKDQ